MRPGTVRCLPAAALACLLALLSCGPLAETGGPIAEGPSTETGNPALAGMVRDTSGLPAGGSLVLLYRLPPGSPDSAAFRAPSRVDSMRTGADGGFRFDSLAPGEYALEASRLEGGAGALRSLFSFRPGVEVPPGNRAFLRRDTLVLRPPARVSGFARRDANPRPAGVVKDEDILVRIAGTERAAYTDTSGRYVLENVPEGVYRMSFAAADGHYLPGLLDSVAVAPGASVEPRPVTLAWSAFVAPPSPAGLAVTADSAAGLVHLRWSPVSIPRLFGYEVVRFDSAAGLADTFSTGDTAYVDTVGGLPPGRLLGYAVHAVDILGNRSPAPASRRMVAVPVPPDTSAGGAIPVVVLDGAAPAKALVRLYSIPSSPGPVDSLPRRVRLLDSARTGADGRTSFFRLPAGLYSLEAVGADGDMAFRVGAGASPEGDAAPDTLRLAPTGSLTGMALRRQLWCSAPSKGNENIEVSLAGTPYLTSTFMDVQGRYTLPGVPAGAYRAVAQALPRGCFLPDTVDVRIRAGQAEVAPDFDSRYNPGYVPPVAGLAVASQSRGRVELRWDALPSAYGALEGYEVVRRDSTLGVLKSSGVVRAASYTDDVSEVPSGTRLNYAVRVVDTSGRTGPFGGDLEGRPVYWTVP